MSFLCPIHQRQRAGQDVVWVDVPLTVAGANGEVEQTFIFDTGCHITTVSEDVAGVLGLPAGGRTVTIGGTNASGPGRLVDVRFRFPKTVSGTPGLEVTSTWAIATGRTNIALLGFMELHRHFCIKSHEFEIYFISWTSLRGVP